MSYSNLNRVFLFLCILLSFSLSSWAAIRSFSDIAIEEILPEKEAPTRNPFGPAGDDPEAKKDQLKLEGVIEGQGLKLALISGKVYREGSKVKESYVKDIAPGYVSMLSAAGIKKLEISNYHPKPRTKPDLYEIAFQSADLRNTIRLIAIAKGVNMLIPDGVSGPISLVFHETTLDEALGAILRANQLAFIQEGDIFRIGKPKDFVSEAFFVTEHIPLHYANAANIVKILKEYASSQGKISSDTRTNTVIVRDSTANVEHIKKIIANLDKSDVQIRIEAKILDVSRNFSRAVGIQWGLTRSRGRVRGFGNNVALPPSGTATSGINLSVGNILKGTDLSFAIGAAEDTGDVHIISQPSITTVNNTPASIRSGLNLFVKNTSTTIAGGDAASGDSGVEEIQTGVELNVTPQMTSIDTVKLIISAIESEADFSRAVDGIPPVIENSAETTVVVDDGETTVIGGLMKARKSNTRQRVPLFSKIPVLGALFRNKLRTKADNELLIFITPHVIREPYGAGTKVVSASRDFSKPGEELERAKRVRKVSSRKGAFRVKSKYR